jgi:hypothetical protein
MYQEFEAVRKQGKLPCVSGWALKIAPKMINAGIKEADKYGVPFSLAVSYTGTGCFVQGEKVKNGICRLL